MAISMAFMIMTLELMYEAGSSLILMESYRVLRFLPHLLDEV